MRFLTVTQKEPFFLLFYMKVRKAPVFLPVLDIVPQDIAQAYLQTNAQKHIPAKVFVSEETKTFAGICFWAFVWRYACAISCGTISKTGKKTGALRTFI